MGMIREINWKQQEVVRLLRGAPGTHYQEASDAERMVMRDWVRNLLQIHAVTVTFVKADGAVRDMLCTLNYDLIPDQHHPKQDTVNSVDGVIRESRLRRLADEHSLRVFDLDKQAWRSFRFDRLKKLTADVVFE